MEIESIATALRLIVPPYSTPSRVGLSRCAKPKHADRADVQLGHAGHVVKGTKDDNVGLP